MTMRHRLGLLAALLTAIGVFLVGVAAPKHNWDMIAYVAAAHQRDGHAGRDLHARTYADVRAEVDRVAWRDLTGGPYRATVARDPVALDQQLPFYTIRVAYIAAVRAVGGAGGGGSYTRAAHLVAALFGGLSILAMAAILLRAGVTPFVLPLLVPPIGLITITRYATPDTMACFASLLLVIALFRPRWWTYALVAILPAIRSDYVIFSALAAAILFFVDSRPRALAALAAAAALYLLLGWWSGNYGYLNLLNFTLFGQQPYPARLPISTDPAAYAAAIATNLNYLVSDGIVLPCVLAAVLLWRRRSMLADRFVQLLLALPLAFATIHVALFPSYDKRFLVSSFFLIATGILHLASRPWTSPPTPR